ncbi:TPA: hypothetical protein ACQ39K_001993 [Yersinia enterocolitica]
MNKLTERALHMKEFVNDDVQLFKLTLLWPDDHLIYQLACALIKSRTELAALKELPPVVYTDSDELLALERGESTYIDVWKIPHGFGRDIPLFTAARPSELEPAK